MVDSIDLKEEWIPIYEHYKVQSGGNLNTILNDMALDIGVNIINQTEKQRRTHDLFEYLLKIHEQQEENGANDR